MTVRELVKLLDPIVWSAHLQVKLPENAAKLRYDVPVNSVEWELYWKLTRREARGDWHGATGRIAERLGYIGEDGCTEDWTKMRTFHSPEPAKSLGDSSHDYSYLVERAAVLKGGE